MGTSHFKNLYKAPQDISLAETIKVATLFLEYVKQDTTEELYEWVTMDELEVVEDTRKTGRIYDAFNSTFIALIPKTDHPSSFKDFRPISLCNYIYKIMAKIISNRLTLILYNHISPEQFYFLENRQIHEAIGVAQEGLHSVHTKKIKGMILKIDPEKAFDQTS